MNLENYVNLTGWVEELNSTIRDVLLERLKEAIVAWTAAFNSEGHAGGPKGRKPAFNNSNDENTKTKLITMDPILHELTIRNQVIFLEPPLEHARAICFSSLHDWLGISFKARRSHLSRCRMQSTACTSITLRTIRSSLLR
jgi:dynein heavy chain 1, cytosolic